MASKVRAARWRPLIPPLHAHTLRRAELDEDLPAHGKHYCIACSRYFVTEAALGTHLTTKPHKKRIKELSGAKPHNQTDADWAGGMGAPDNGQASRMAA